MELGEKLIAALFILFGFLAFLDGGDERRWWNAIYKNDPRTKALKAWLGEKGRTIFYRIVGILIMLIGMLLLSGIVKFGK
jgi:uncharacterized membrane protein YkgB